MFGSAASRMHALFRDGNGALRPVNIFLGLGLVLAFLFLLTSSSSPLPLWGGASSASSSSHPASSNGGDADAGGGGSAGIRTAGQGLPWWREARGGGGEEKTESRDGAYGVGWGVRVTQKHD